MRPTRPTDPVLPIGRRCRTVAALALAAGLAVPAAAEPVPPDFPPEIAPLVSADEWAEPDAALSGAVETARLKSGILCVAWARDMIDQHWHLLDREEGAGTWTSERQTLWRQIE